MEFLTLLILKCLASSCIKFYIISLMAGGPLVYSEVELGYKVPRWYMNPGRAESRFYSYGTSIKGDEFESIEYARNKALNQMVKHIRLSNQALIKESIRYDKTSIKQRRLVDLFVRGEGLEDFVRMNAKADKRQLVKVPVPQEDMRAFVRLCLSSKLYVKYQKEELNKLKIKLVKQRAEDILDEMEREIKAIDKSAPTMPGDTTVQGIEDSASGPPAKDDTLAPDAPRRARSSADSAFDDLDKELKRRKIKDMK